MIRRLLAISQITVLETLWRKHLYVLLLLLLALYFYFGRLNFFNMGVDASFVKLVPITGLSLFGVIISVFAAARQFPDELAQKTIFPLLAKPVTRFEFLAGKFLGVTLVVAAAILITAASFQLILSEQGVTLNRVYWQAVVLLILQLSVFISLVIALSIFLSHAAVVVLSFLLYYLLGSAGSSLEDMLYNHEFPADFEWFYRGLQVILPRLDLFNISKAVLHNSPPLPWTIILPFAGYAFCYCLAFLLVGAILFSRKDL